MFDQQFPFIEKLRACDEFQAIDVHLASMMCRLCSSESTALALAVALTSHCVGQGHTCFNLHVVDEHARQALDEAKISLPKASEWENKLSSFNVVGGPNDARPLVLHEGKLYLARYFSYENELIEDVRKRFSRPVEDVDLTHLTELLDRFFPDTNAEIDWQKVAVFAACLNHLCVISGGPGTGKTTTVARMLAILLELRVKKETRVVLAAPTGKAAARMLEATQNALRHIPCTQAVRDQMPTQATTLHRLLGGRLDSPYFFRNRENPLSLDILVVDEVSMVDLPLMAKLFQALPKHARVVLLGDKDQLASVEAGAVLGDVCGERDLSVFSTDFAQKYARVAPESPAIRTTAPPSPHLGDGIIQLTRTYRFSQNSGIAQLSKAVRAGDVDETRDIIEKPTDIVWLNPPDGESLETTLTPYVEKYYSAYARATNITDQYEAFNTFRILSPLRHDPRGVYALNKSVENILKRLSLLSPTESWYAGQTILVTANAYGLGLFNGDVGIVRHDAKGDLRAFFPGGQGTSTPWRTISLSRLPAHEKVFAMTVHKSQGSEFEHVLLALPRQDHPILTRELLYTAISRAKKELIVVGEKEVFTQGVSRKIQRSSGLRQGLWGKG